MSDAVVEMRGIEALANGRDIISGAADAHIQRWDAHTGELVARSAASHEDRVIDGASSADGTTTWPGLPRPALAVRSPDGHRHCLASGWAHEPWWLLSD